jgi:hypothetical protein
MRQHILMAIVALVALSSRSAVSADDDEKRGKPGGNYCSQTAGLLFEACQAEAEDDNLVGEAICINISDSADRADCLKELDASDDEAEELCAEQYDGRLAACKLLGEGRYDPDFDPALFDNPKSPTNPNPYFPLKVGNKWTYKASDEIDTVEVLGETKAIDGVKCIVVRDVVQKDSGASESTDDWYAPAKDGNTWYCGEEVKNYETFDGDNPKRPELVSIDGSFKAGRDGDKPGIISLKKPKKGDVYLEEFSLGNAEDVTVILSTSYAYGKSATLDQGVPKALAKRFCPNNCVVTKNFSLLEPGIFARKYSAPGIGVFLEVEQGEVAAQLVSCNFDSRCNDLPQP